MATIVKLHQGSPDWHAHRAKYRNASETPAVLGVSPYTTPFQLWQQRTGRVTVETTAAMAHGTATEPEARALYETRTGMVVQPLVMTDGLYSASLDGIDLDGSTIVEIKCPKSKDSTLLKDAVAGRISVQVYWQVQTQLMVSGAQMAHVFVFDGKLGHLLEQPAEPAAWDTIRAGWDEFMCYVEADSPPPLSDGDVVVREDDEWASAAQEFIALKAAAEAASDAMDAAKTRLVGLTQHTSERGAGVAVARFFKSGAVDYRRVPELAGVDVEGYRAKGSEQVRVTVAK